MLKFGDCYEILPTLEENSVDLALLDIPYSVTNISWDHEIDLKKLWILLERVCKTTTPYFFCCTQKVAFKIFNSRPKSIKFRYDFIWEKNSTGFLRAYKEPMRNHESVLVFYKKQCLYNAKLLHDTKDNCITKERNIEKNPNVGKVYRKCKNKIITTKIYKNRLPRTLLKFENKKKRKRTNSTQKPLDLFEFIIKYYSRENDVVLDPFCGSGTTIIACKNLNRKYICIERDERQFKLLEKL